MKRSNQNETASHTPKFSLAIDVEQLNELRVRIDQRKKLDDAVNSAPAEISAMEGELAGLRHQLSALEADVVLIDDAKLPALQKEIAKLVETIDAKDLAYRRLKARIDALEARAPDLDNSVELAIGYVRVEANMAAQNLQSELAEELRKKLDDVRAIYAQVRALHRAVPRGQTSDFLLCTHVPDLEHCMASYAGGVPRDTSQNLLELKDDRTAAAESEIVEALRPITEALLLAHKHKRYVPLAKRPTPYVRKGAWDGPGGRTGDRIEHQSETQTASAGDSKEGQSGKARTGPAVEMNMTAAMAAAAQSREY